MVIQTLCWRTKIALLSKIKLRILHLKISKTSVKNVSELCEWGTCSSKINECKVDVTDEIVA